MKKLLSSMAAATFLLGMFAFTPVTASETDNVQFDEVDLAVLGTCTEAYEVKRRLRKCIKTYTESAEDQAIGLAQQQDILDNV